MTQRVQELVKEYNQLLEQVRALYKQNVPDDFPELATLQSEMDRLGDELLSLLPPPAPLPMPQWLRDQCPNLANPYVKK